ncbi:MAG: hypothetical protein EOP04_29185 [Proteobacteria bacterium]|nr:MAG: hypothetical protein EOP04_29185 [Pseudomonadota bacterium]
MKKSILVMTAATLLVSSIAMANFDLASNGKTVTCKGNLNQTITLKADRTSMTYVTGHGAMKLQVSGVSSDNEAFTTYETNVMKLTLSNFGDSIQYGDESQTVTCK